MTNMVIIIHSDQGKTVKHMSPSGRVCENKFTYNMNGVLHSIDDMPSVESSLVKVWHKDGLIHRENGPAVIRSWGCQMWYRNGVKYAIMYSQEYNDIWRTNHPVDVMISCDADPSVP